MMVSFNHSCSLTLSIIVICLILDDKLEFKSIEWKFESFDQWKQQMDQIKGLSLKGEDQQANIKAVN